MIGAPSDVDSTVTRLPMRILGVIAEIRKGQSSAYAILRLFRI